MLSFGNHYLKKYKLIYSCYVFFALMNILISLLLPYIISQIINFIESPNKNKLFWTCIAFAIFSLIELLCSLIKFKLCIQLQTNIAYDINLECIKGLQKTVFNLHVVDEASYLTQRVNNDCNSISSFVLSFYVGVISNVCYLIASLFVILFSNLRMGITLIILLFLYLGSYILYKNRLKYYNNEYKESQADFFSKLSSQLEFKRYIQIHSLYNWFWEKLDNSFSLFFPKIYHCQNMIQYYSALTSLITSIAHFVIYFYGGLCVINNNITLGNYLMILTYFNFALSSLKYFSDLGNRYQNALVSKNRIEDILSNRKQHNGSMKIEKIEKIMLDSVKFGYGKKNLFTSLTYSFCKGKIYGVKGRNGIGKSSLLYLLAGLVCPDEGKIMYNEIDISKIDMEEILHNKIAFIDQECTILKKETIFDNIFQDAYQEKKGNLQSIEKKVGQVGENLNMNVCKENISGGERQKLVILRELTKNYEILLADEPTSSLDVKKEEAFGKYLQEVKKDKIIVLVVHGNALDKYIDVQIQL